MLPESTFVLGGALTLGLGLALAVGLLWAGAGLAFPEAWFAVVLAVGFGGFFVAVGRGAARERRAELQRLEATTDGTPNLKGP